MIFFVGCFQQENEKYTYELDLSLLPTEIYQGEESVHQRHTGRPCRFDHRRRRARRLQYRRHWQRLHSRNDGHETGGPRDKGERQAGIFGRKRSGEKGRHTRRLVVGSGIGSSTETRQRDRTRKHRHSVPRQRRPLLQHRTFLNSKTDASAHKKRAGRNACAFFYYESAIYDSLCTMNPERSFGSNHVALGGMMLPESAIEISCFIDTG